jgi:hypothetical protein
VPFWPEAGGYKRSAIRSHSFLGSWDCGVLVVKLSVIRLRQVSGPAGEARGELTAGSRLRADGID